MTHTLFPFASYWWLYLAFTGVIAILLAIDLSFHRRAHVISFREAGLWTAAWMALALVFSYVLYLFTSARLSLEFLAGYVVEESLSVDNMFVFALLFRYFAVPPQYQHRVLFYGVLGAMVFRGIFIAIGAALIRFDWVLILFGLFLIFTAIRMAFAGDKEVDPGHNPVVRWVRRLFPVTHELHGRQFFVTLDGVRHITPLMVVLLCLETTDIVFAVDSVPAVFGVTKEPLIVYTSNVFAILGLRAMYFLLSGAMDRFYVLKYGLAGILAFVGLKMVWLDHLFGGRFPIGVSLAIISAVIAVSIALSLAFPRGTAWRVRTRHVVGVLYVLLGAAGLLFALGLLSLPGLAEVRQEALYISAACYVAGGVLLLCGSRICENTRR